MLTRFEGCAAEIQQSVLATTPWAWLYFGSFIFIGAFVGGNLFIAVVINNLESVKREQQATTEPRWPALRALLQTIEELRARLEGHGGAACRSVPTTLQGARTRERPG